MTPDERPSEYLLSVEPELVAVTETLRAVMSSVGTVDRLGLDWRVVIERNGRPAAEVRRTRDHGISVGFYGDEPDHAAR